jgi:hypothetical protein
LKISVVPVKCETRDDVLVALLNDIKGHSIVYATTQKKVEEIAKLLNDSFETKCYHAGLDADLRKTTHDWFYNCVWNGNRYQKHIRNVIYYNISKSKVRKTKGLKLFKIYIFFFMKKVLDKKLDEQEETVRRRNASHFIVAKIGFA